MNEVIVGQGRVVFQIRDTDTVVAQSSEGDTPWLMTLSQGVQGFDDTRILSFYSSIDLESRISRQLVGKDDAQLVWVFSTGELREMAKEILGLLEENDET